MKLIDFAKRRPDGLIDQDWVDGFEACKLRKPLEFCPCGDTSEFNSWVEGWIEAAYSVNYSSQSLQDPCEDESQ